ncbi:MAG: alpha/beta fold hydrolase [Dokdonella sp.]
MEKRNLVRLAAIVAVVALFAGKRFLGSDEKGGHTAPPDAGPAIEQKAGERGFTLGSLAFAPCELDQKNSGATTAAFCAPMQVPENWDKPDGRKLDLKLALVRSDAQAAARDLVVFIAGGPGQSATESYPNVAPGLAPLRRHRNILLLDQRGTGGSHSLICKQALDDSDASEIDYAKIREQARACLDEVSKTADPAQFTTTAAVRDLEAVRQALGAPRFNMIGVSYGTRVAQQYAMRYPDGVRSLVLDSAAPNELVLGSEFAVALEDSLKAQFALCTKTPACAKAFGDPYVSLYRLRDALVAKPAAVEIRNPRSFQIESKALSAFTLAQLVRLYAYTPETGALLPLVIDRALKGDTAPLVEQSTLVFDELSDLGGNGMQLSVICSEDADLMTDRGADAKLLLGDAMTKVLAAQCEIWPHGTRPKNFHDPIASDKPALILSGEFDPVTPPRYADRIVKGLPSGRVLHASGQGHGLLNRGCFPKLIGKFIETLDAKALDAACVDQFGPTPAFIDYNGATP